MKTDWFELREARLHLAPYTDPHFPIAVASTITPAGMMAAGKHGLGVLSLGAGLPGRARGAGQPVEDRRGRPRPSTARPWTARNWRARRQHARRPRTTSWRCGRCRAGERHETITYFEDTLGRPPGRVRRSAARRREDGHDAGRLARHGDQGHRAPAWSCSGAASAACCSARTNGPTARQTLRSYELFAR